MIFSSSLWVSHSYAATGIYKQIPFQGKIVNKADGTNITDGTYTFIFALYDASSGGNKLWGDETQSSINVTNGIFNVYLGANTALTNVDFNQDSLYLQITFNGEAFGSRIRLAAVPYAFNADKLDGVVATNSASSFSLSGSTSTLQTVTVNGNITIGSTITPTFAGGLTIQSNGANALNVDAGGAAVVNIGNTNATSVSICNSATCDSISIGTNNDVDTIGIGDSLDSLSIASTAFTVNTSGAVSGVSSLGLSGAITGATSTNTINGLVINSGTLTSITGYTQSSGNFGISGTGTFSTGTGSISLNGVTTLAANKALIITGASGDPTATNGTVWYDTNLNKFKIVENGTVKVLCNTTDAGCGAGGASSLQNAYNTGQTIDLSGAGINAGLTIGSTSGNGTVLIQPNAGGQATLIVNNQGNGDIFTASDSATTKFVINSTGNVGIGTSLPGTTLHINGTYTNALNPSLRITSTLPGISLDDTSGSGNTRNWSILNSYDSEGLLEFVRSTTAGAVPNTAALVLDQTGKVGIGTTAPTSMLDVAGNVKIDSQTNAISALSKVTQVQAGQIASGGTTSIASISAMAVYNGSLYVGTGGGAGTQLAGGAEIYRYNGTSGSWTLVSQSTPGTIAASGTSSIASISAMAVFNGQLYIGTSKTGGAEIYRYDGGTTWTRVSHPSTAGSFNGTAISLTAYDQVTSMTVMGGKLFAGISKSNALATVIRYEGTVKWTALNSAAGNFSTPTAMDRVDSMVAYSNTLVVGVSKTGVAGEVLKWSPTANNDTTWVRVATGTGTIGACTNVNNIPAMAVYNGKLFIGVQNNSNQAAVCRYEDTQGAVGIRWTQISNTVTGTIRFGGTTGISAVRTMTVYNDRLYIGTEKAGQAEIYQYIDGDQWSVLNTSAGTLATGGTSGIDKVTKLIPYNGSLFVGTGQNTPTAAVGAEVYTYTNTTDQSYALQFHAASSWTSEQNNLQNTGSIYFMASPSANFGSNIGNSTGSFIFSNGIVTTSGAYDVAEDYPTRDLSLHPGDLVSIDPAEKGMVRKSQQAYDTKVLGVYSENPALHLSQQDQSIDGADTLPVALVGRVSINVSTESGQIEPGDYLVSSSVPGIAMKAVKPGPIIGQALESFQSDGIGKVLAFVQHGYYDGRSLPVENSPDALTALATVHDTNDSVNHDQASLSSDTQASQAGMLTLTNLSVDGLATISADLRIKGNGLVEGILSVIDSFKTNNLITTGLADFFSQVIFHGDILIKGHPTVSADTAGVAVIKKDHLSIRVTFSNEYDTVPVVTTTLSTDQPVGDPSQTPQDDLQQILLSRDYQYIIVDRSSKGFTILLNKKAQEDITFSWIALGVDKSLSHTNEVENTLQVTPSPMIDNSVSASSGGITN